MSDLLTEDRPRIKSLDVIRGFAVLGILAVNAIFFAAPWQTAVNPALPPLAVTSETLWSWFVMHVAFEYKCITLFSMLFGVSLYLVGGEQGDSERGLFLRRRLAWLAIFGLIHGLLIWYGDVLLLYAVAGLLLMPVRSWSAAALARAGLLLFALSLLVGHSFALAFDHISPAQLAEIKRDVWAPPPGEIARTIAAYRNGFISGLNENVSTWTLFATNGVLSLLPRTAAMMMFGLALYKTGFFSGAAPLWLYLASLALGALALAAIAWQAWLNAESGFSFEQMQTRGGVLNSVLSPFVSLAYAAAFILLVKHGLLRFVMDALAAVGRMAFSNYIAQSLIMTTFFWGGLRGFGLFGELTRPQLWLVITAMWVAQLIWSRLWLKRFRVGPLEWIWRRLTYARPVAFAKSRRG